MATQVPVNAAVVKFVQWVHATSGVHCLFFTCRPAWSKEATTKALRKGGYAHYDELLFCKTTTAAAAATTATTAAAAAGAGATTVVKEEKHGGKKDKGTTTLSHHPHYFAGKTCRQVKECALREFTADRSHNIERRIIAIVGDQDSDFAFSNGDPNILTVKIPNYIYAVE